MNVVFINGSPRMNGNTSKIIDICKDELKKIIGSDVDFGIIILKSEDLSGCRGCRLCFDRSEKACPNKDDLLSIKEKIQDADLLIMGSPVYVEDVSGLMKNFIDRMAFNTHRPFLCGKPVYIFTTSGAGASSHAVKTIKHAAVSWGGIVTTTDNYRMGTSMTIETAEEKYVIKVHNKMNKLYKCYKESNVSIYSLIGFSIQKKMWKSRKDLKAGVDYLYWQNRGWLKDDCIYYSNLNISYMKKMVSAILSFFISKILL